VFLAEDDAYRKIFQKRTGQKRIFGFIHHLFSLEETFLHEINDVNGKQRPCL